MTAVTNIEAEVGTPAALEEERLQYQVIPGTFCQDAPNYSEKETTEEQDILPMFTSDSESDDEVNKCKL